jgi:hypothetical protein
MTATTDPAKVSNMTAAQQRLAKAYSDGEKAIEALTGEADQIKAAALAEVDSISQEIARLQAEIAIVESGIPTATAVIDTLIQAEQAKLDFLAKQATQMVTPQPKK